MKNKELAMFYIDDLFNKKTKDIKLFDNGKEALEYFYSTVENVFQRVEWEIKPDYLPYTKKHDIDGMKVTYYLDGVEYRVRYLTKEEKALYELLTENNLIIY